MSKLIIFGCGYVGQNLSALLSDTFEIIATHKNTPTIFNIAHPLDKRVFDNVSHILISIPPITGARDLVLSKHLQDLQGISTLKWIGYLSSTGVYGNHDGKWVNEESALLATDESNLTRINIETRWLESFPEHTHIFRLAGIYGPGRAPEERIKNGVARRIQKPGCYFSRIHINDICAILCKSMQNPTPGEVLNLADDLPEEPIKVIEYWCDKLQLPYPPLEHFESADLSPMLRTFYTNNKKVSNTKVKALLNYQFLHPNYKV
jgi:nucleoside-diphosphate-sugar epimerase